MISKVLSDAVNEINYYLKASAFADCYVGEQRKRIQKLTTEMDALQKEIDASPTPALVNIIAERREWRPIGEVI